MSATVINLMNASLRLRIRRAYGKVKQAKEERCLLREMIRADAERSIQELEREQELEYDEPDSELYIGASGEWSQCATCFCELNPASTVVRDLVTRRTCCANCFQG